MVSVAAARHVGLLELAIFFLFCDTCWMEAFFIYFYLLRITVLWAEKMGLLGRVSGPSSSRRILSSVAWIHIINFLIE